MVWWVSKQAVAGQEQFNFSSSTLTQCFSLGRMCPNLPADAFQVVQSTGLL